MGAAAGNDDLLNFCFGPNETIQGVHDGEGSKDCGSADEIVGFGAVATAEGEEVLHIGVAVVFAAGGFGRGEF